MYDSKADPHDYVRKHIMSLLRRTRDENVKCLMFPTTLTRSVAEWFNSLLASSIKCFEQLQDACVQRYFGVIVEVLEVTLRETISAFQRGLKILDFKKDLIILQAVDRADLAARNKRFMKLKEALTPCFGRIFGRVRNVYMRQALSVDTAKKRVRSGESKEVSLTFTESDSEHIQYPHDDALVITTRISLFDVKRILVDTGTSVDILLHEAFYPDGTLA
ncbi:hypothetical protein CRG98_033308 [Punica granatum]|uniref:Retrotransposon gag domain-containing protein n=1 Tax=Punica granatum TaxID=22663 RepID=A0A2I0IQM4_PUNGR|nr:hypothetical protein CRG98_033308 [Punica granatum]